MSAGHSQALPARGDDGNPTHAQVVEVPGDPSFASPTPSPLNFAVHGGQAGCVGDARRKVPRRYLCYWRREMHGKIGRSRSPWSLCFWTCGRSEEALGVGYVAREFGHIKYPIRLGLDKKRVIGHSHRCPSENVFDDTVMSIFRGIALPAGPADRTSARKSAGMDRRRYAEVTIPM